MGRRSFLKGLVAASVLSPLLARPGPPRFLVATSMQDAVDTGMSTPGLLAWAESRHIPPGPDGMYHMLVQPSQAEDITQQWPEYGEWIRASDLLSHVKADRGIPVNGTDGWGYVSDKIAFSAAGMHWHEAASYAEETGS